MRFFIKKYAKIAENECVLRTFDLYIYSSCFSCCNRKSARIFILNGCFFVVDSCLFLHKNDVLDPKIMIFPL